MRHLLIRDKQLNGWEYGMLRCFESAIMEITGATAVPIPDYAFASRFLHHFGHGMNRGPYRRFFPKQEFRLEYDVAWYILMGPENYRLDLYNGWQDPAGKRVLYLYDTMPSQYPLIKRLFSDGAWDVLITSFNDAVEDLQQLTGRKWYCVEQAADSRLFRPVPSQERVIHFSSYGRRYPALHEALKEFCQVHGLYYDYTTHDGRHPVVDSPELYQQYAWHLSHSLFTFSWPVELTNPARAGHLRPITCRWFEAAAAGAVIVGRKPGNAGFDRYFPSDAVIDMDPAMDKKGFISALEALVSNKDSYSARAHQISEEGKNRNSWQNRVTTIELFIKNAF